MRGSRCCFVLSLFALLLGVGQPVAGQNLLKRFMPVSRVDADPAANYTLNTNHGPWLVMACTFSGQGAEQQAHDLVMEFRQRFNLPAYLHRVEFDRTDETVGRGLDERGDPVRMRYRQGNRLEEWAVLVGEFPVIDDPDGQKLLKTVKSINPQALKPDANGQTARSLAFARSVQAALVPRIGQNKQLGPMRTAFMARNPLLPQEYFVPKGIDKTVEKWNQGVEHNLLNNPKRYTVKVATFGGASELQGARKSSRRTRKRNKLEPLEEAALNAHELAKEMRRVGIDAYEFHDRYESIVTVGGFDEVTQRAADGSMRPLPEVVRIIQKFDATYNTPVDPLQHAELPSSVHNQAQQQLNHAMQMIASKQGQVAGGLTPKFARIPPNSKNARVIPFDIHPQVIEVPKKSISAGFAWR